MHARGTAVLVACGLLLTPGPATGQAGPIVPPEPAEIHGLGEAIAKLLDGRTFSVDTGKEGNAASGKDVVRFSNGMMSTALCIRFGFTPAPYMVRVEGSKVHFRSEMVSATQGKLVFNGHIEGDRLIGKAEWAQVRWYWTVNVVLWFDGTQVEFSENLPVYIN